MLHQRQPVCFGVGGSVDVHGDDPDHVAVVTPHHAPADRVPAYAAKYAERIGAIFGTVETFATTFSEAIVITPRRLHA